MGWLALLFFALAALGALVWLRVARPLWSMVGAALMLGATGYALQGSPTLPASAAAEGGGTLQADPDMIDLRGQMFGRYGIEGVFLTAADALARSGSPRHEINTILSGIRQDRGSVQLWTALGDALARHDRALSPAASLAFGQAAKLSPRHPGPPFFRGLALLRASDFAGAEASWRRALALTPAEAGYRAAIAERLTMLRRLRAAIDR